MVIDFNTVALSTLSQIPIKLQYFIGTTIFFFSKFYINGCLEGKTFAQNIHEKSDFICCIHSLPSVYQAIPQFHPIIPRVWIKPTDTKPQQRENEWTIRIIWIRWTHLWILFNWNLCNIGLFTSNVCSGKWGTNQSYSKQTLLLKPCPMLDIQPYTPWLVTGPTLGYFIPSIVYNNMLFVLYCSIL